MLAVLMVFMLLASPNLLDTLRHRNEGCLTGLPRSCNIARMVVDLRVCVGLELRYEKALRVEKPDRRLSFLSPLHVDTISHSCSFSNSSCANPVVFQVRSQLVWRAGYFPYGVLEDYKQFIAGDLVFIF